MHLFPEIKKKYTSEQLSAREAQRLAEVIAWGPVVFQASRLMMKWGILDMLRDSDGGMTEAEVAEKAGISPYAAKCLLEASLSIGTVLIDDETDRYHLAKTGWFLITDQAARVNMAFNHDVNYEGMFNLEGALKEGRPAGLEHFGPWPTLYEGLSSLPEQVQKSWFGFDHFYSDSSFPEALRIVFDEHKVRSLYDVGGNTGKWALQCVAYNPDVQVTILDLPQQIKLMQANTAGKPGAERISGHGINLLDPTALFPKREGGLDAMLSIIQMPPGIPVATVGVNGAMNAAILAMEMLALGDADIAQRLKTYKSGLGAKIEKANKDLAEIKYTYKCN